MPDLVSILIPAYNAARWLDNTIRSALAQTWLRTEIIIVDDGSRDRTLEIAKSFERGSIKVVTQPNMGAPAARNRALEIAQGSYIQWLDADDLLDADKIEKQMKVACEVSDRRLLLSCPFGTFYHRPEKARFVRTSLWRDLTPLEYFLTRFTEDVYFQTGAWLASRELTDAAGPWSDSHSPNDDGEYFCRVAVQSTGLKFVKDARAYYRIGHYGRLSKARSAKALTASFGSQVKCIRYLMSLEESPRTRAAAVQLLQDRLPYYYQRQDIIEEARRLARELGDELRRPKLKRKYMPVEWLFGYGLALKLSRILPRAKARAIWSWDGLLHRLSSSVRAEKAPPVQKRDD
jgi:glycosyltransferase involved in cell wall biosynthesis